MRKKITIKDIAQEAACHYSLVSLALREETAGKVNPETRAKIREVCQRLNYVPDYAARQLVRRDSKTILFALPYFAEMIASEPFAKMISGVMSGTSDYGQDLHLLIPKEGKMDQGSREILYGKKVMGIITAAPDANKDFFEELKELEVPIVVICTYDPGHQTHHVYCDNEGASLNAISYLIQCGHKNIAMIKGPTQSCDANARFQGYLKSLKKQGVPFDDNLIVGAPHFSSEAGYLATKELFSRFQRPSAIFCANDDLAIGCLKALKDSKIRCPEEISVIGFDNIAIAAYTDPPLTTVEQPFFNMGRQSVELLADLVDHPSNELRDQCVDAKLVVRESVKSR